ncbi:MAG: methylenetetrahydrofolate--tRNA-(uracil(54)-C(5))-methyltransferase (FADH(2)-oxidizing) TrmFO [Deltaproteobacteria bacterium]|nr:methylenetetrahydrofolate--tRNA-(uracil(54)-C(5))-methyltransferase (FADH(2)-oxidizing) TrmFO [Deltaproteobacteria bacterium]
MTFKDAITIIGGGLAGSEAAWQVVKGGGRARIVEMKPVRFSPAHSIATLSELVCSNSLKSESMDNASGLLKAEMRTMGSLILSAAEATRVPAGNTLAVDRTAFSKQVTEALVSSGVEVVREELKRLPDSRPLIIATGPLTTDELAADIQRLVGSKSLNFYDAVAPIVYRDSIDMSRAFKASRWGKGGDDYINCPMDESEYERFFTALVGSDRVGRREFEDMLSFEGCMPIEVMAERGPKTLLFGPMRPVGLTDPRTGKRPFAVVQLRRENFEDTLYNMVGFQTRLKFPEQKKVFRTIPGLEAAEFARLGKLHRNIFIDSPKLLTCSQQLKSDGSIFFAGQITGVEGYTESAVSGILAGINALRLVKGLPQVCPPPTTMTGALMRYISEETRTGFQPMNSNMGLLPRMPGKDRREKQIERALADFSRWHEETLETLKGI